MRIWSHNIIYIIFVITKGGANMQAGEDRQGDNNLTKQKIRERYKGVDEEILDIIPAMP